MEEILEEEANVSQIKLSDISIYPKITYIYEILFISYLFVNISHVEYRAGHPVSPGIRTST